MKWLYKLEYKHGKNYIRKLMTVIVAGMVIVYLADMMLNIPLIPYLTLNRAAILQGQVWRLITFIFVPPNSGSPFTLILSLFFYYIMGSNLESHWGGFRLNIYYLFGILGAIIAMFITGSGTNEYINLSLFLAFATISPDTSFMLFFIIPIKAKWMALFYAVMLVINLINAFTGSVPNGLLLLVSLAFSLLGYLIFFGRSLIETVKNQIRIYKNRRNWQNRNR